MEGWHRRTVLATGVGLAVGSGAASVGAGQDDSEGEDDTTGAGDPDFERPTEVAWRYDGSFIISRTVATDGRVYTQAAGGVTAIEAADGEFAWETGDIGAFGTLSLEDDTLYVAGDPIQAVDADKGDRRWESELSSTELVVGHETVFTSVDGTVYALDATDGSIRWERESVTVDTDDGQETVDELAIGDVGGDAVYVTGSNHSGGGSAIIALEPETGDAFAWVTYGIELSNLTVGAGHVAGYGVGDETAVVFDVLARELVIQTGTFSHSISGGAFFANGRNEFVVYDLSAGGERAWERESYYAHSQPVVVGNTVIAAHGSADAGSGERIIAYDLETGNEQWQYDLDGEEWTSGAIDTSIVVDENTVYVPRGGELVALRTTNGQDDTDEVGADESDDSGDTDETDDTDDDSGTDGTDDDSGTDDTGADDDGGADGSDNGGDEDGADSDTEDDGTGNESGDDSGTPAPATEENDLSIDTDSLPGFTTVTGIVGGGLGLEWLRRRAEADDPAE
ncbi:PQQ-binding-like beta-propeller repeat protein [Natronosalvus vescus]|uniref:outer membrane protein assembly factor BamB family protein n=1 Tax=Natronosalvus vescus TaxID=2953881 RepID=UPI002090262A|nr:PQQ-binding-like beta-propeller repeat protein [Natronosalvus vescus]